MKKRIHLLAGDKAGQSVVIDANDSEPGSDDLLCGTCCGNPISGKRCICGGVGTQAAELQGFREFVYELEDKLDKVRQWVEAYPLDVFPEPDFKKARKVLEENGMTLDAISASNMRHVINGVKDIINP